MEKKTINELINEHYEYKRNAIQPKQELTGAEAHSENGAQ